MIIITTIIIIVIIFFFNFFQICYCSLRGFGDPKHESADQGKPSRAGWQPLGGSANPRCWLIDLDRPRHVGLHPTPACADPRHVALVCYPGTQVCRPQARKSGPSTQGMTAPALGFCSLIMPQQNQNWLFSP
jgi:hypothetical protein